MSSEFGQFLDDLPDLNLPESKKPKRPAAYFVNLHGISKDTYKDLVQLDAWLDTPEKLSQWRAIVDAVLQRVQRYEKRKHKQPAKHPWPLAREAQELNLQTDEDLEALCVIISLWHDQYTSGYPVLTAQQKETIRKWPYRPCSYDAGILPQWFVHLLRYVKAKGLVSDLVKVPPPNLDAGAVKGKEEFHKIDIDLSQWYKSGSRALMHDLLDDEFREGVKINIQRHGRQQPAKLKRSLNSHRLKEICSAIIRLKGERNKYKLNIPHSEITFESPKT